MKRKKRGKKRGQTPSVPGEAGAIQWVQVPHGQSLASSRHYVTQTAPVEVTKLVKPVAGRYRAATQGNDVSHEIVVVVEADSVWCLEGSMQGFATGENRCALPYMTVLDKST
jgi:hypothetical protein